MRFERNIAAENLLCPMYGQEYRSWWSIVGDHQFVISFDPKLDAYSATYKKRGGGHEAIFIGENNHPHTGLPYFSTLTEAERACAAHHKKLRRLQ